MAKTFTLFSRLPAELQLMIWDAAVVDRQRRNATYVTMATRGLRHVRFEPPPCAGRPACHCRDEAGEAWEHPFMLGCMADGGLWEACHDSRAVMKRRFTTGLSRTADGGQPEAVTALGIDCRGVARRCTFVPSQDMFVFDTSSFIHAFQDPNRQIDLVSAVPAEPAEPALSGPRQPPPSPNAAVPAVRLRDLRNIAIKMDPRWLSGGRHTILAGAGISTEQQLDAIASIAVGLPSTTTIHLYDDSLHYVTTPAAVLSNLQLWVLWGHWGRYDAADDAANEGKFYGGRGHFDPVTLDLGWRRNITRVDREKDDASLRWCAGYHIGTVLRFEADMERRRRGLRWSVLHGRPRDGAGFCLVGWRREA